MGAHAAQGLDTSQVVMPQVGTLQLCGSLRAQKKDKRLHVPQTHVRLRSAAPVRGKVQTTVFLSEAGRSWGHFPCQWACCPGEEGWGLGVWAPIGTSRQ